MLKPIPKLPRGTIGFTATDQVTAKDYESVLMPAVEAALKKRKKIRFLYHLGPKFSGFSAGAMWDDAKIGLGHIGSWERIAVVTDVDWIRLAIRAFAFALPGEIKVFPNRQLAAAKRWLAS